MDREDEEFNQAFGRHTGISEDCRDSIRRIKNNNQLDENDEPMFRLDSDTEHFTVLSWTLLGRYIANNTQLESVDLDSCNLTNVRMGILFSELDKSSLSELDIRNNPFGISGTRSMIPFLENSPYLSALYFNRNNNINTECFEVLIKALRGKPIFRLHLPECNITDISALETYNLPNLNRLNLYGNKIGREGCIILSNLLQKEGTTLKYLDLDNTSIDDEGAEMLAASLKSNTKLKTLYLSRNNIALRGVKAFLKVLVDVSSIESTYISNHTLTELEFKQGSQISNSNEQV